MHVHTSERQQPYNCRTSQSQNGADITSSTTSKHPNASKPYPTSNPTRKHGNNIIKTVATTTKSSPLPSQQQQQHQQTHHHYSNPTILKNEFNPLLNSHEDEHLLIDDVSKNMTPHHHTNTSSSSPLTTTLLETTRPLSHSHDLNTMTYSNLMDSSLNHLQSNANVKHELEELSNDIRQQLSAVTDMTHHLTHPCLDDSLIASTPWYACGGNLFKTEPIDTFSQTQ